MAEAREEKAELVAEMGFWVFRYEVWIGRDVGSCGVEFEAGDCVWEGVYEGCERALGYGGHFEVGKVPAI